MSLIAGDDLEISRFFSDGNPKMRGSSFDLTIGRIIDHHGEATVEPFNLKPGHMVQVISDEIFDLPSNVTGHVTYKTALTRDGIWALTVGIIDPGWKGPVSTTLFNFSRRDYAIDAGTVFLRVSFFEHAGVDSKHFPQSYDCETYRAEIRKIAMTKFPATFLNQDDISEKAAKVVINRIQFQSLAWVALIAIVFTLAQISIDWWANRKTYEDDDILKLKKDIQRLELELARRPTYRVWPLR